MSVNIKRNISKIMLSLSVVCVALFSYSAAFAACPEISLGTSYGNSVSTGSTLGGGNDINTSCGSSGTADISLAFTAPFDVEWTFDTIGSNFDTTIAVFNGSCSGEELACNDDIDGNTNKRSSVTVRVNTGQTVVVNIEGFGGTTTGNYVLNINPTCQPICNGKACGDNGCGGVCGVCDDGNDCTDDICDEDNGTCSAQNYANGTACDDGFFCTVNESCTNGACGSGDPKVCVGTACQTGYCDENSNTCEFIDFDDGDSCDDGLFCTVGEFCQNGACSFGSARNCGEFTDVCNLGECSEENDECFANPVTKEGNVCDDGSICTSGDECVDGACVGGPAVDCSHLDSECSAGACDSVTGDCFLLPINNGQACDDGTFCQVDTTCNNGTCGGGQPYDCSSVAEECVSGVCNENFARCDAVPIANGGACDDGVFCTVGETCTNGLCSEGTPRDCSSLDDQCNVGYCDLVSDSCMKNTDDKQGYICEDGKYCTLGDTCNAGVCVGGSVRDCASFTNQCAVGECDLLADTCFSNPIPKEGEVCDDGLFCVEDTSCVNGACTGGTPVDCSAFDDQCNSGYCDEDENRCSTEYDSKEGFTCDDGEYCNSGEKCERGDCTGGSPRNCDAYSDQCNIGICSETNDTCYSEPSIKEGHGCDDGLFCTEGEACHDGTCDGGSEKDCSDIVTEIQCQVGVCNEEFNLCQAEAANEAQPCDDGQFCMENEICQNGFCLGEVTDCSSAITEPQCEVEACDEVMDRCFARSANEGLACEDGLFCNEGETCNDGICLGGSEKDCSDAIGEDQCQVASCDEDAGECVVEEANDGMSCDDGLFCTINESCTGGACGNGDPRDCSEAVVEEQCQDPACDEENKACVAENKSNDTVCDDENICTEDDLCTDGVCGGLDKDCSDGTDCTVDICDPVDGCVSTVNDAACDTDDDPCTAGLCDAVDGCSIVDLEDWTVCKEEVTGASVCLDKVCTKIVANDRCPGAYEINMNQPIHSTIGQYNSSRPLTTPCSPVDYVGPDSFYSIDVVAGTDYTISLVANDELTLGVMVWSSCDADAVCMIPEDPAPSRGELVKILNGEQIAEDMEVFIQVVALEAVAEDANGAYMLTFSDGTVDGDEDDEIEEEIEEEIEDGDEDLELEEELEEEQDEETLCTPQDKECRGSFIIVECNANGSSWELVQECVPGESECIEGQCKLLVDGDEEEPEDGDLDPEKETDPIIDGDLDEDKNTEAEMEEEVSEGSSGGCNHSHNSAPLLLLLALGFIVIRKRLLV